MSGADRLEQFRTIFSEIKRAYDSDSSRSPGLVCKQGINIVKLQKPSWTNDSMDQLRNYSGVFFCVWIDDKGLAQNRIHFNIHALKMRLLEGYSITSIDFAQEFRKEFQPYTASWPNVSVAHGPLTLMQGWIDLDMQTIESDVLGLMERFTPLAEILDKLLESRIRTSRRAELAAV